MRRIFFNLHLFDAASAGAEGTPVSNTQEVGQPANDPGVSDQPAQEEQERENKYREFLKEYKDLDDKRVGDIVKKRLKGANQLRQQFDAVNEAIMPLYEAHGIEPGNIQALSQAIQSDNSLWERGADDAGMTVEQYKQMQHAKAENARLSKALAQESANRQMQAWHQEAERVKGVYPEFDLMTEIQNPLFAELISSKNPSTRLSLKAAYEATHVEEIRQMAARSAYQAAETNVSKTIQANGHRANENAAGSQPAAKPATIDIKNLTKAQRRELELRAERGERITFREGS